MSDNRRRAKAESSDEKPEKGRAVVRLERWYAHSPERVWNALTNPEALSQWLLPTQFKPVRGHRFRFTQRSRKSGKEGRAEKINCRVIEVEAPHRLAYLWQSEDDKVPTLVTWTLEPLDAGTLLRIEHIGPQANGLAQASMRLGGLGALCTLRHTMANRVRVGRIVIAR